MILEVLDVTSHVIGVHPSAIYAGTGRDAVRARRVAMVVCEKLGLGQRAIGRAFQRDHKTVAVATLIVERRPELQRLVHVVLLAMSVRRAV